MKQLGLNSGSVIISYVALDKLLNLPVPNFHHV